MVSPALTHSAALSAAFEGEVKKRRSGSTLSPRPELRPGCRRVDLIGLAHVMKKGGNSV